MFSCACVLSPFLCDMAVTLLKQVSSWRLVEYSNKTVTLLKQVSVLTELHCNSVKTALYSNKAVTLLKQVSSWRLVEYSNKTQAQVVKLWGRTTVPSLEVLSSSLHPVRPEPQHSLCLGSLSIQQSHRTVSR